jgi:hypothetical protein
MIDYLKGVIQDFPEEITGRATSPAADHLFTIRSEKDSKPLEEERAIAFHHSVAQILFTTTSSRKDIQTSVAFLTTRVGRPDEDDWQKLKRVIRYIKGTIYLPLILRADRLNIIKWWVDASFATHDDCRGHTGAPMSLGKGPIIGMSKKQKINTRSSTECELVGADDAMPQVMWTRYFIEAQGFGIDDNILAQDNLSTMLIEKNGKQSSSKRTKHIRVRYFFIKDRVANNDISIRHCPTGEMLADHFTKPLQGSLFRKFRADIQGISADLSDVEWCWERVEKCKQKARTDPSTPECVEGTTEGSPGDPSGTYADDPGNKVRDQGHQGGTRVSGEDSRLRTSPINGTMHTRADPVNGTVCTQTAQSNGTVCTQTAPSNAWTVVSGKGTRSSRPYCRKCPGDKESPEHVKFAPRVRIRDVGSWSYAEAMSGDNKADYLLTTF